MREHHSHLGGISHPLDRHHRHDRECNCALGPRHLEEICLAPRHPGQVRYEPPRIVKQVRHCCNPVSR
ncbi:hypothetical protein MYA_4720 [Burkholderia sp. KJ006]|nr:hypothetical protein MYA_4720 [Burkholderia sp. KJ006]